MYNTATGKVTAVPVSEEEYQNNTKGGTTNLVVGDPSGHLMFDYSRTMGGVGGFETNKYLGAYSVDVGERDDIYKHDGGHFEGSIEGQPAEYGGLREKEIPGYGEWVGGAGTLTGSTATANGAKQELIE